MNEKIKSPERIRACGDLLLFDLLNIDIYYFYLVMIIQYLHRM